MNTPSTKTRAEIVIAMLGTGKAHAISRRELSALLHTDPREISEAIHEARAQGVIICSTAAGYYLPADFAELLEAYSTLNSRALSLLSVLKAMREEIKRRREDEEREAKR